MAEKFILHVEVLFATIDDLEADFARLTPKGEGSGLISARLKFISSLGRYGTCARSSDALS